MSNPATRGQPEERRCKHPACERLFWVNSPRSRQVYCTDGCRESLRQRASLPRPWLNKPRGASLRWMGTRAQVHRTIPPPVRGSSFGVVRGRS